MLTTANYTLVIQLLTVATVSLLAQLAMQSSFGSVGVYIASNRALDCWERAVIKPVANLLAC